MKKSAWPHRIASQQTNTLLDYTNLFLPMGDGFFLFEFEFFLQKIHCLSAGLIVTDKKPQTKEVKGVK